MPVYEVEDAQGRILELEGEREPTQAEIADAFEGAFATEGVQLPEDSAPSMQAAPAQEPGTTGPLLAGAGPSMLPTQAFPAQQQAMAETAKLPGLTLDEAEMVLTTPQVSIPRVGEPGTVTRGLSELGAGLVEQALLTPLAPLQNLALAVPGVRLAAGTLLTAAGAKAAAEKAGEASVTGNPQTITEAIGLGAMTALGGLGVAGDAMARIAPATAAATRTTSETLTALIPENRRLPAPRTRMPEFSDSTYAEGALRVDPSIIPAERRLPAPGMPEFTESTRAGAARPVLTHGFEPGEVIQRIVLPLEPEAAQAARQIWSKPIDVEAQVTGSEALRSLVKITDEVKTHGQPYKPPVVSTDLRQLEKMLQRNTVSKVESWADEVLKRKMTELGANGFLDPEFLAAATVKGAVLVKRGVVDFATWSGEMRKQFGNGFDDKLPDLFRQATAGLAQQAKERAPAAAPAQPSSQSTSNLIDGERIKTAIAARDVMPARDWLSSPEFEFRNDPLAKPLVTALNEAELTYKSRSAHATERFEELRKGLSESEQLELSRAFKARQAGDTTAIEALPKPLRAIHDEIRTYYDNMRSRVIATKQESVMEELSGPQQNALRAVQDGVPLEEAAKANGLRASGRDLVRSALDEMRELESWGVEDYTTNIERGSYRVVTEDGTTVAIAETRPAAAIKADRWLKEHPEVKSVTLDDQFNPGVEFPTKLSQGQYYRLVAKLRDSLDASAVEIQDLLRSQGSPVSVKPTNKYAGPMQQRRNVLKGEENMFDVLPAYAHVMEKKLALDPVMKEARSTLPKLQSNTRAQVEDLIGDVKGRKTIGDKIVDDLLRPYGLKPFAYSRSLDATRQVMAKLKLGYRPVAAAVNRISGALHTWTKVGTRYMLEGRAFLKTPEGEALLQANKPYLGIEAAFVHEAARPRAQEPLWKPLGMFQAAERFNRPESFAALYKYAEGELGLTGDAAVQYARNATRFGQFTYNTASLPRALRGPTGRFLFQFKPYLVKELEFISSLKGAEIPRYIAGFLAVGGPRAALYTLKSLPLIGAAGVFMEAEDWLNRKAPVASRGIGGAMGVDVSPSVAFQFPTTPSELLGPTVSDLSRLWTDVVGPAIQGEDRDLGDVRKWAMRLAPALNYWSQLVDAVASDNGWQTDARGRMAYKPSKADLVKFALGAKPLEKSIAEVETRFLKEQQRVLRANSQRAIDKFLDAVEAKDGAAVQELAKELSDAGVSLDAVKSAARNRNIDPQLRLLRSLPKVMRAQEAERFAPQPTE